MNSKYLLHSVYRVLTIAVLLLPILVIQVNAGLFDKLKGPESASSALNIIKSLNVTESDEIEIGSQAAKILIAKFGLYNDIILTKYISLIGNLLATNCERNNLKFYFNILNADDANAYACPGGFIFITKGAIRQAKNEDELAAILAHEISHITLKHEINEIKKSNILKELSQQFAENNREVIKKLTDFVVNNLLVKGRNRKDEYEADAHSLQYLSAHNYNPVLHFYLIGLKKDGAANARRIDYLTKTHPPIDERVSRLMGLSNFTGSLIDYRLERFRLSTASVFK